MRRRIWLVLLPLLLAAGAVPAAEDVLYYQPNEEGFLLDWLVSTRHPFDYAYLGATMNYDALKAEGGESNVRPQAGRKAGRGNPWLERHFKVTGWARGVFELPPASMHMTYTFAYIHCDEEKTDLVLLTGSDDALRVLLNGRQVQKVQMQRGYNTDQDRVAGITLRKGFNRLLCKIDDYMGGHGLVVRFKDAQGRPVTDLKICLARPPEGTEARFVNGAVYEAEAARLLKEAVRLSAEDNDPAAAEAACRRIASKYPKSRAAAEALYHAGTFLVRLGQPHRADETFRQLLERYPYAKWAEDALMALAELAAPAGGYEEQAVRLLEKLIEEFPAGSLVPEAMLRLAALQARKGDLGGSDALLTRLREQFPNTVEAVRALDRLGDNRQTGKQPAEARKLWQQVLQEADALTRGKYVWYVNVQAMLKEIADRARDKLQAPG